jgi:hypothetical protein
VLDTGALLAYTQGTQEIGELLSTAADDDMTVLVPATCLAAAYRHVNNDGWDYLDILANLPQTEIAPLTQDFCALAGSWARTLGLDTAHAAIEAASRPVVPLVTACGDLVTQFLPREWPIIDI